MNGTNFYYAALALLAGIGIPILARLNTSVSQAIGNTGWAALILFSVGFAGTACSCWPPVSLSPQAGPGPRLTHIAPGC
jgi:uncharacterized membrane protein YdcZ (DUF606 family)